MMELTNNVFVSPDTSPTTGDSEVTNINFRSSLRFFQEQLLSSGKPTAKISNGNLAKYGLNQNEKPLYGSYDSAKAIHSNEKGEIIPMSSKITPIPTVDTILESVRILRAIQKSQQKRGKIWTLDFSEENTEALESYKSQTLRLHIEEKACNSMLKQYSGLETELSIPRKSCQFVTNSVDSDTQFSEENTLQRCTDENVIQLKYNISDEISQTESIGNVVESEEIAEEYFFPASFNSVDEAKERNLDLPLSERSTSAEFDSAIGTDKSLGSLSPNRGDAEAEKDLWSDSSNSHYASAAGSPYDSWSCPPVEAALSSIYPAKTSEHQTDDSVHVDRVSSEALGQDCSEEDQAYGLTLEVTNCKSINVDKSNLPGEAVVVGILCDVGDTCRTDVEPSDISHDRLFETVEEKVKQLEFDKSLCSSENCTQEVSTKLHSYNSDENSIAKNDYLEHCFSTLVESTDNKIEKTENQCDDTRLEQCSYNILSESPIFEQQFSNETSAVLSGDIPNAKRMKTNVTFSWDPVVLIEHLYDIGKEAKEKNFSVSAECMEGYLKMLSAGEFLNCKGEYYVATKDSFLFCYESERKGNVLTQFSLKYATVEREHGNILSVDNRLGRSIRVKFTSDEEMERWKTNIQSHCDSYVNSDYIVPILHPLKSSRNVIIIDLGSCSTRAGILMDQPCLPTLFFPSVCSTDKITGLRRYGVEALAPEVRRSSNLSFPVRQSAKVTKFTVDVDSVEGLFKHIFRKLNVDPKNYIVQVSVPRSLSTNTQVALVNLLLENLEVQAVSLTRQALLTMYANDVSTAIVVDIGDRLDILPVVDGFILENGVSRLPHGGHRIIHHMKHALAQKHISLSNDIESFVVQHIAENLCYVTENFDEELKEAVTNVEKFKKSIPLSSYFKGENILQSVTLDTARFQIPEGLFNPDLWGLDIPGIHKLVHQAIQASCVDMRRMMAENIYVSGGVTLIPGFVERLQKEVEKLTLPRIKPRIHSSPFRYHMAYLGACRLGLSSAFHQACLTADEWRTFGTSSLNKWHL